MKCCKWLNAELLWKKYCYELKEDFFNVKIFQKRFGVNIDWKKYGVKDCSKKYGVKYCVRYRPLGLLEWILARGWWNDKGIWTEDGIFNDGKI